MMHIHIHRRRKVRDRSWTGTLKAVNEKGRRIEQTQTVNAPDHYAAGDKLKASAKRIHGDLTNITIQWEEGPSRLQSGGESSVAAARAGVEEDRKP